MLAKTQQQLVFYRHLLKRIAKDMEAAARAEDDPKRRKWFESRARRVRDHLVRGMPEDWTEPED